MSELFYNLAMKALKSLPKEFTDRLTGVEIVVEDFADQDTLNAMEIDSPWNLLGLYSGIPLDRKSVFYQSPYPERIYLYKKPIMQFARSGGNLYSTIRGVLLHEIGHHFGFDDDLLEEMEGRKS
jgi:predicted Zn-dependent protease with MMP-like domain